MGSRSANMPNTIHVLEGAAHHEMVVVVYSPELEHRASKTASSE